MWLRRASLPKRQQEEQQQPDESNVRRVRKPNLASPSATPIKRTTSQRYERTSYPDMMMYISADRRVQHPKYILICRGLVRMMCVRAMHAACYAFRIRVWSVHWHGRSRLPSNELLRRSRRPGLYARKKANFVAHAAEAVSR